MIDSRRLLIVALALPLAGQAFAQGGLELLHVQGNVHMIAGPGGNTAVQTGPEAVIVVDTQTATVSDALLATIKGLSPKPIRHIIVTSADPDHTGGNAVLSSAGTSVRLMDSFEITSEVGVGTRARAIKWLDERRAKGRVGGRQP